MLLSFERPAEPSPGFGAFSAVLENCTAIQHRTDISVSVGFGRRGPDVLQVGITDA
jgi:hypothetical protein